MIWCQTYKYNFITDVVKSPISAQVRHEVMNFNQTEILWQLLMLILIINN